jgi:hypothetical protein
METPTPQFVTAAPDYVRNQLKRVFWCGNGSVEAPIKYGWVFRQGEMNWDVYAQAKAWLKANGFTYSGGKWGRKE